MISCLRGAGVEVIERHQPVWDGIDHKWSLRPSALVRLALAEARLAARRGPRADVVVVGYPGHLDLSAARLAARGAPVAFNPLVSLEDTFAGDRARFRRGSPAARLLRTLDHRALAAADLVVADTAAQARLFAGLGARRVEVAFVGAEERLFRPGWEPRTEPTCLFVGKLAPLHGLETILGAAGRAPEVTFRVVGSGQLEGLLRDPPRNVRHVPWVAYERLPAEYSQAAVALGIFGRSPKAARVIPNKVFQALACGTPVITADTPAARELLEHGRSALLVPAGDPGALAAAVRRVVGDRALAKQLSRSGLEAYRSRASEDVLGRRWRALLEQLC